MTIETKYNVCDLVRYKSYYNTSLYRSKEGKITTVNVYCAGSHTYITYTVVNPENQLDTKIIFE